MKIMFALVLLTLLVGGIAADDTSPKPGPSSLEPVPNSPTPEPTTTTPKPKPDDKQKEYILSFMSYGINIINDNLFDYCNKTPELTPIFNLTNTNGIELEKHPKYNKTHFPIDMDLYFHQPDLNPLLNATFAAVYPGNYSYQLHHSTYYGRVSGETIARLSVWKGKRTEFTKDFLNTEFVSDTQNLVEEKKYKDFLQKYGTHCFTDVDFGGIFRMQTHVTDKYVRDVSQYGFQLEMLLGIVRAFAPDMNVQLSYDFYYHNHYENSTYGGNMTLNASVPLDAFQWFTEIDTTNEIVPTNFTVIAISDLIKKSNILADEQISPVIEGLTKATQNELNKFKVKSYMEAMDVVRKNPYGRSLGGSFDAQFLYSYFEGKLNETNVVLDEEFDDNVWAAEHNAQAILNRRAWFEKPYPPEPTTLAPTTEPTKANSTEAATTTVATTKKV